MIYHSAITKIHRSLLFASLTIIYTLHENSIENDNKTSLQLHNNEYHSSILLPSSEHIIHNKSIHKNLSLTTTSINKQTSDFIIVYDKKTRSPKYTIERLHAMNITCPDDLEASLLKKKRKPFYTESSIINENFKVIH